MVTERLKIIKFIEHISNKNFAKAHKLARKISRATDKPLF